jgi:cAMP phosphodiesterase
LKIRFLGTHNAQSKNSRLVSFLVDDTMAVEAGSLASELTFEEQAALKYILVTHGHYDHIRDIPALAFNNTGNGTKPPPTVVGVSKTLEILKSHLMDGLIYPDFTGSDSYLGKPSLLLKKIDPAKKQRLNGYEVLALPVNHPLDAVGFFISAQNGDSLFYTGDSGPGLSDLWKSISPQTLIVDTSFPSRMQDVAHHAGHLCPECLLEELKKFRQAKGYFPRVYLVHLCPEFEGEIKEELRRITGELEISVEVAEEGKVVDTQTH